MAWIRIFKTLQSLQLSAAQEIRHNHHTQGTMENHGGCNDVARSLPSPLETNRNNTHAHTCTHTHTHLKEWKGSAKVPERENFTLSTKKHNLRNQRLRGAADTKWDPSLWNIFYHTIGDVIFAMQDYCCNWDPAHSCIYYERGARKTPPPTRGHNREVFHQHKDPVHKKVLWETKMLKLPTCEPIFLLLVLVISGWRKRCLFPNTSSLLF